MTTSEAHGSAKIYQFPARGRFAEATEQTAVGVAPRVIRAAIGDGWYHDEAIREAERLVQR